MALMRSKGFPVSADRRRVIASLSLNFEPIMCLKSDLKRAYSRTSPLNFGILGFSILKAHSSGFIRVFSWLSLSSSLRCGHYIFSHFLWPYIFHCLIQCSIIKACKCNKNPLIYTITDENRLKDAGEVG